MKVVLALCVVAAMIASSEAVKCYVCSGCDTATGEFDCGDDVTGCTKVVAAGIVARSCGTSGTDGKCLKVKLFGIKTETCYCDGALCNSAGTTTVSVMALLAPLAMAKLFN